MTTSTQLGIILGCVVLCSLLLLTGCTSLSDLSQDGNVGTIAVPDDDDCQYRRSNITGGAGLGGGASGGLEVITVTNAELCTKPETIEALERLF